MVNKCCISHTIAPVETTVTPPTILSYPLERVLQRNNLLTTIPRLTKSYTVKFQIKPTGTVGGWSNILHMTANDNNCCNYGDRNPAVFVHGSSTKLHICSSVSNNGNHCVNPPTALPINTWTAVEITQRPEGNSFRYQVKVGGKVYGNLINTLPKEFTNVKVYSADNWYIEAKAVIRNLVINPNAPIEIGDYSLFPFKYWYMK